MSEIKKRLSSLQEMDSGGSQLCLLDFAMQRGHFERLMERVLVGLSLSSVLVYLDDIVILGRSFMHQLQNLRQVLQQLQEAHQKLAPKRCTLFHKQVKYLGQVVTSSGISPDSGKLKQCTHGHNQQTSRN